MKENDFMKKTVRRSAWFFYALIVLEILYMISPFALYYYSLYKVPLKVLQANSMTAFLTTTVFPHFCYQDSRIINLLMRISWPLIMIGLLMFLVSFMQIYWAKLTRQGSISKGLYRFIRHPQYVALAVLGLGTTLYWSRFLVCLMYASMLFLYYFLARQEEEICLEKFNGSYAMYRRQTGMFLPRSLELRLVRFLPSLPVAARPRRLVIALGYGVTMAALLGLCFFTRDYALDHMVLEEMPDRVVVAVAPLTRALIGHASRLALADGEVRDRMRAMPGKKELIYVFPEDWSIPELGVLSGDSRINYLANPLAHGNSGDFDRQRLRLLICRPVLRDDKSVGRAILKNSLGFVPLMEVGIDLQSGQRTDLKLRNNTGKWDGIPVPLY